jgi:hypothetical protein
MLSIALLCYLSNAFAGYTPVTINSGFNADVIANGVGSSVNSCVPFDINNQDALVAPDWALNAGDPPPDFSLPALGVINSVLTPGLNFNLASYSANNVLRLDTGQTGGTLGLSATGYGRLYFLVAGTNGNIVFSATLHFSDGSQQVVDNLTANDWNDATASGNAIEGIGFVRLTWDFALGSSNVVPRLYQVPVDVAAGNINKTITGISYAAPSIQDYQTMGIFAVSGVTPCTGTPDAANVISTNASACAGVNFTLSLSSTYSDAGINYQWQSSTDNINWVNLSSAGNQPTAIITQSAAHYYRCTISCAISGMSTVATSTFVDQNAALACYCTPIYDEACDGSADATFINDVLLNGDNGTFIHNIATGCSSESFTDYSSSIAPVSLTPLHAYTLALSTSEPSYYGDPSVSVWIDINDDGFFDPVTELVGTTGSTPSQSLNLNIPLTFATGDHRMRIRTAWFSDVTSPCDEYGSGETEDYLVNLLPPPSCIYPIGITSTPQSLSNTIISWMPNSALSYDYVWDQNNANIPVSSSIFNNTTDTFVNLSGLVSGAEYYFHVRSHCSATDTSLWITVPFSIPDPCGATALSMEIPYNGDNTLYPTISMTTSCGDTTQRGYYHARLFKFTPTTGDWVNISTCGSSIYNDYFRVYSGNCSNFVCVGGSSTNDSCFSQQFSFQATANNTYYISWGVSSNFNTDTYTIEVSPTTAPLAIRLESIEAKNIGAANQINWITASEDPGDHFELERSADGSHFNPIASIDSHQKPSKYVYLDNNPLAAINYYRLKMMDIKGRASYSKIVQANVNGERKITMEAYPNPVNKQLTLRVFGTQNGTVTLTDIAGRAISSTKMNGSELQVDMSTLSTGFYLLHYSDENLNQVIKVNKQ